MRIRVVASIAASIVVVLTALVACGTPAQRTPGSGVGRSFRAEKGERHFGRLRMLTDGGENAEAYFSFDGRRLSFQSTRPPHPCDQIFTMRTDGTDVRRVSSGKGRTTCSFYLPGDRQILYASTEAASPDCPAPPDMSHGYTWALYPGYDIYVADADGSNAHRITTNPGYDAEATISPLGDRIVFTSLREGDLDIYSMNLDGSDVKRLTTEMGYDGGAFFSPDGKQIVYRAYHPATPEETSDYRKLLDKDLIRPTQLEIWIMDADGSNKRQVTHLGAASFAPFFHPSGKKILFSSNYGDPQHREFELFMVDVDGTHLEQVTHSPGFDGFPMFSPDGKQLVFCSNRHDAKPHETNVFITDWRD